MITRLKKPITRVSGVTERGRPLVVTLHPRHLEMHLMGKRRTYTFSLESAFWQAIKRDFEQRQKERAAGRRRQP